MALFQVLDETALRAAFRPRDLRAWEPPPGAAYPLRVRDCAAWRDPSGIDILLAPPRVERCELELPGDECQRDGRDDQGVAVPLEDAAPADAAGVHYLERVVRVTGPDQPELREDVEHVEGVAGQRAGALRLRITRRHAAVRVRQRAPDPSDGWQ